MRAITERAGRVSDSGPALESPDWPELPARYRILEHLGTGGMGSVYRVLDREDGYEVALKTLHGVGAEHRGDLKREFRTLADIVHPNLVALHELVVDGPHCFFTMELVLGASFTDSLQADRGHERFESRLHDAASQLALALNALHYGGKVHRDVKSSNALVSDAGRVVLLDFGLTTSLAEQAGIAEFAGTLEYAAPEQIWGQPVTAAADWYAFGATLFEAVSGRTPHEGAPHEIAFRKRSGRPQSLRGNGVSISKELDTLIRGLLEPDARQRPSAEEVLSFFGAHVPPVSLLAPRNDIASTSFVGRELESTALADAFDHADAGHSVVFELSGTSGIGKSALVRQFLERLSARAVVLTARCHPQEALAFNALDGIVDDLNQVLARRPELKPQLSDELGGALARLFPALGERLEVERHELALSAQDVRRLAFSALRSVFQQIACVQPVVLWIDDAQWADEDSGALLAELIKPPARLLTIFSLRSEDREGSACLRVLARAQRDWQDFMRCELSLFPLDSEQSAELLRSLLGAAYSESEATLAALVQGTGGSPFFLRELALFLQQGRHPHTLDVSLAQLLRLRIHALPVAARRILEVFAVAGAPLEQSVALRAAGVGPSARPHVADLERLSMLRTTDVEGRASETYHHRIRDEVLREVPVVTNRACHRDIALALLSSQRPNPLLAVDHFEAAEDHESLRRYVVTAAQQAHQALAFERAARLYERALALGAPDAPPHELQARRALAYVNAGQSREAALAFQEAAAVLAALPGSDLEQRLELRQRAAEHFIQSGQYAEGLAVQHSVMEVLDSPLPRTRGRALTEATLLRLGMVVRGVRLRPTPTKPPAARELLRFDALWSASVRVSMIDYALSSYAVARCATDALRLGEPIRLTRALALEATNLSTLPAALFSRRADELFVLAAQLATQHPSSYNSAFLSAARGVTACFRSQFRDTVEHMDAAIDGLQAEPQPRHYELSLWQTWAMIALSHLGEIRELTKRADLLRKVGTERGDRFVLQMANLGRPILTWLAEDRAEHALENIHLALSWAPSDYNTQHYWHFTSTVECELYRGNLLGAWQAADQVWPAQEKNHFLQVTFARDELLFTRARAALGYAALLTRRKAPRRERKGQLALVSRAAKRIRSHGLPCGEVWALLALAGVEHVEGRLESSAALLREALAASEACGMQLHREAARFALGALGGDEGRAELEQASSWMRAQGIQVPASMVRMLVPGIAGTVVPD